MKSTALFNFIININLTNVHMAKYLMLKVFMAGLHEKHDKAVMPK